MKKNQRKFSPEFKLQVALEALRGERTIAEISRTYDVNPSLVGRWKADLVERGHTLFEAPGGHNNSEKRISELEQIIGKLTVELDLAKNFLRHYSCR